MEEKSSKDQSKKRGWCYKFKRGLEAISLGKYRTPLYFRESESYSSMLGGIFSILFILFMGYVAFSIFYAIINKDRYELS